MEWKEINQTIEKDFTFSNFREALEFTNRVGELAEEMDHHPDILLHGYKHVRITLTTHSEGKVTEADRQLAVKIDHIVL